MKSNTNRPMIVRMTVMLLAVGVLFGGIFGFQYFKAQMIKKSMLSSSVPPAIVSVTMPPTSFGNPRSGPWETSAPFAGSM